MKALRSTDGIDDFELLLGKAFLSAALPGDFDAKQIIYWSLVTYGFPTCSRS